MLHNVALEKVDANMEEATIGAWLVAEGDTLAVGGHLVELITDKVTFQWECAVGGTVRRLLAAPGSLIPIGYIMAQIGDPDDELPDVEAHNRALVEANRARHEVTIDTSAIAQAPAASAGGRVRATPAARRLGKEHNLDLADLPSAQAGQIVTEDDVRQWLAR